MPRRKTKTAGNRTRAAKDTGKKGGGFRSKAVKPARKKTVPDKRQDVLREILLSKRREVLRDMEEHLGKQIQTAMPTRENEVLDSGDLASQDLSEDMDFSFLERRTQNLKAINEAIQRLQDKTYGICDECGTNIPEPRLSALPFAKFCISCQEKQEIFEKIEREEDRFK